MQKLPFHGAQVFRPLPLNMDERPLTAAEGEMLQAGKREVFFFPEVGYTICVQDTPSGSAAVSIVTV